MSGMLKNHFSLKFPLPHCIEAKRLWRRALPEYGDGLCKSVVRWEGLLKGESFLAEV